MAGIDLSWIQALTNLLSIITIIMFTKQLLLKPEAEFRKKWLIAGLVFSDCTMHIGYILIIGNAEEYDNSSELNMCKFQAFMIHFGMLSSFMWINCIVFVIYNSLTTQLPVSGTRTFVLCTLGPFFYCLLYYWSHSDFGCSEFSGKKQPTATTVVSRILTWQEFP